MTESERKPCDNPSGQWCQACRDVGAYHCSDPEHCGGMRSMEHHAGCPHNNFAGGMPRDEP